jgi:peroxiredoxin
MWKPLALLLLLLASVLRPGDAGADGLRLDGRPAPDFTVATVVQGLSAGTRLSALRGKVVWLRFWLRDCPHCHATNPAVQSAYERWGTRGLSVLTLVHEHGPEDPALRDHLRTHGLTFPVGTDRDGSIAQRYGVHLRPTDYLVGIDGRVVASNGVPERALHEALGRYRLARLGALPPALESLRDLVWRRDLDQALAAAEAAAAGDASEDVLAVRGRVVDLATEEVEGRLAWARALEARGQVADARRIREQTAEQFAGTVLEERARAR